MSSCVGDTHHHYRIVPPSRRGVGVRWTARSLRHLAVLLFLVGACSNGEVGDADTSEPNADLVAAGEIAFQAYCASCHGVDARGTDRGPSFLSNVYVPSHHGDAAFWLAARNGVPQHHWRFGDMEPVEGPSDDDIEAITAFVRQVQQAEGFEPYPP